MVGVSVENAVLHLPGESFITFAFQFTFVGSSPSDFCVSLSLTLGIDDF